MELLLTAEVKIFQKPSSVFGNAPDVRLIDCLALYCYVKTD
ncbi:hypothetical protein SAMN02744775_01023 [Enterobacter sp. CC120223-11]|nr:hypothetical protein SAMN02744775_01023 [Enterobacter sp. CC120223-11]